MGGHLFLHGNSKLILDVISMVVRDAMKPHMDLLLENVKSICHQYPTGTQACPHPGLLVFWLHLANHKLDNNQEMALVSLGTSWVP